MYCVRMESWIGSDIILLHVYQGEIVARRPITVNTPEGIRSFVRAIEEYIRFLVPVSPTIVNIADNFVSQLA